MPTLLRPLRSAAALAGLLATSLRRRCRPHRLFGLDNANLSAGGAHPNADAASASFASAAGALATQDFDGAAGAVPGAFSIGAVNAAFTNLATAYTQISAGVGTFSTFPISGTQYLESLSGNGSTYFSIAFDQPLRALGFYLTDPSDWIGNPSAVPGLTLNLFQSGGTTSLDLLQGLDASQAVNGNVFLRRRGYNRCHHRLLHFQPGIDPPTRMRSARTISRSLSGNAVPFPNRHRWRCSPSASSPLPRLVPQDLTADSAAHRRGDCPQTRPVTL